MSVGPFVFNNLVTNSPGLGSRTTRQPAPHHQTATMTNPPLRFLAGGTCEANARTTTRRCTSNRAAKSRCDNFSLRRATLISSNNSTFDNRLSPHHGHQKATTARTTRTTRDQLVPNQIGKTPPNWSQNRVANSLPLLRRRTTRTISRANHRFRTQTVPLATEEATDSEAGSPTGLPETSDPQDAAVHKTTTAVAINSEFVSSSRLAQSRAPRISTTQSRKRTIKNPGPS